MKKGFTLIELLAVIVILAIIALIATPIVLDIINDAKQSSTLRSVDNILKGAELYVSKGLMDKKNLNGNIYEEVMKIIDGENPDRGNIYANNKGEVAFSFRYNDYCYTKGYEDIEIKVEKTDTCIAPVDYLMVQEQTSNADAVVFNSNIPRKNIEKVYTKTTNKVPSGVIGSFDVSASKNESVMAWYKDEDNNGLYELYIGQEGGVKANPNSSKLFNHFINAVEIDLSNLDTSNVTNMKAMFQNCEKLPNLNINNFNTSNVIDISYMFNQCNSLESIDLSGFDTTNVTTMYAMFQNCAKLLTIDLSDFNTNKVTNMSYMFNYCNALTSLDISNFDTSNVTDMSAMFNKSAALKTLKLNKSSFTKVTNYVKMFTGTSISNVVVKDSDAKTFIEARLTEAGLTGTVTVEQ